MPTQSSCRNRKACVCRCVLYEMAARRTAFEASCLPQLLVKIMRNTFEPLPSHFSRPFQQLVSMILRADPADRPPAARLLALPFVKVHMATLMARCKPAARPLAPAGSKPKPLAAVKGGTSGTTGAEGDYASKGADATEAGQVGGTANSGTAVTSLPHKARKPGATKARGIKSAWVWPLLS